MYIVGLHIYETNTNQAPKRLTCARSWEYTSEIKGKLLASRSSHSSERQIVGSTTALDSKNNHLPSAHTSNLAAKALHEQFPTSVSSLSAPHTNLSQTAVTTDHSIAPIIPGLSCLWAGCPRLWPLQVPTVGLFQESPPLGCSSSTLPAPDGNTSLLGSGYLHSDWGLWRL